MNNPETKNDSNNFDFRTQFPYLVDPTRMIAFSDILHALFHQHPKRTITVT